MSDYAKIADALRFTASEITNCNMVALSMRTLVDGAVAIEELMAQVRDKDYLIQQQIDEIERLRRDVKKQQEKMIELAKKLPKRGKWITHPEVKNIYGGVYIECPFCGEKYVVQTVSDEKFCRNCGADMRKMEVQE